MRASILAAVFWIGCLGLATGQIGWGSFTNYSIKEGLSQSTVTSIFQDSNGFIWFGTTDGLNKYDGQKFTIYKTNYKDSNSLSDNWIVALLKEDSQNNLWILTSDWKINKFNLRNHQVKRFSANINKSQIQQPLKQIYSIEEDGEKSIWISTKLGVFKYVQNVDSFTTYHLFSSNNTPIKEENPIWSFKDAKGALWFGSMLGICKYVPQSNMFRYYAENVGKPASLISNEVIQMICTPDNKTWVITTKGVSLYNEKRNDFSSFPFPSSLLSQKPEMRHKSVVLDTHGNIWIGTNLGLVKFIPATKEFRIFQHNEGIKGSISSNQITAIKEDKPGNIWIGTFNGLNKYVPENGSFINYYAESSKQENNFISNILELKNNEIWISQNLMNGAKVFRLNNNTGQIESPPENICNINSFQNTLFTAIFPDKNGNLWLGSMGNGAIKYTPRSDKFEHYFSVPGNNNTLKTNSILGFAEGPNGNIWITLYDGIVARFDTATKQVTNYNLIQKGENTFTITNVVADKYGELWIASVNGGLIRFNPKTSNIKHYLNDPKNPESIASNVLLQVTLDKSGKIWIGHGFAGVDIFDPQTEKFIHLKNNPQSPNSLSNNSVWAILQDYQGNMWFATDGAIDFYNPVKSQFVHYPAKVNISEGILTDKVLCMFDDHKGNMWFGTSGGGLSKLNTSTKKFIHYTENEGLANNVIYGIVGDNNGNLWLSTNRGLSEFNISKQTFTNYHENDGLQSDEFNQYAYFKSSTGQIYFGGINGFNVFSPEHITKDTIAPETIITGLSIADKKVSVKHCIKIAENDSVCDCRLMHDSTGYFIPMDIAFSKRITLPYSAKVFTFEFTAVTYGNPEKTPFRYKMENFDDDWQYTGDRNSATYTNLAPGTYTFKVSAANSDGVYNSVNREIIITITPPFWKTWWFIAFEIAAVLAIFWIYILLRERNLKHSKIKLEANVKERTRQIEEINEELRLRNAEINRQKEEIAQQARQLKTELSTQNVISEMALLKSQINPHFLFNTLNNIYSLIYQKSEDAPSAVMKLSELMRYMVYETNVDAVPLEKEINYLKSFIELQLLRLKNKDFVHFTIEGNIYGKTIAPMLLIPFVENAFKHGSKKVQNPGIVINLTIGDNNLRFDVLNYYQQGAVNKDEIGGIGVENVKRRLELIHPNSHILNISQTETQYVTNLELTLQ
jgi:ligand-binding sensor domain-containing protein